MRSSINSPHPFRVEEATIDSQVSPWLYPNVAFGQNKNLGVRNGIDFGAKPSGPTLSLSTLPSRRSPGDRQDSLPACPLQLWPDWTFTSWTLSKGFIRSIGIPLSQALLGAMFGLSA